VTRRWLFVLAAGLPCLALLVFCVIGAQEWWLISTKQIAVIPMPRPGQASAPEVPAARLVPWVLGSAALAITFAYALARRSTRALALGYAALLAVLGAAWARHALAA